MGSGISEKEPSESTSHEVKEILKWMRLLGHMIKEEQGFVQRREGMPSWK